ncbi:MAG: hypothetical protein J5725_04395 [Bacteroidales bacterium]|nr:hypothetical protein [Bacteroidales bacterium]
MTDKERIQLLEETVLLMSKCLDVKRFLKLNEDRQDLLMANILHITADLQDLREENDNG